RGWNSRHMSKARCAAWKPFCGDRGGSCDGRSCECGGGDTEPAQQARSGRSRIHVRNLSVNGFDEKVADTCIAVALADSEASSRCKTLRQARLVDGRAQGLDGRRMVRLRPP